MIAHEDQLTCGFGAELAARISDSLFEHLDAPVKRVAAMDVPVAYYPELEEAILPQSADVLKAIRDVARYLTAAAIPDVPSGAAIRSLLTLGLIASFAHSALTQPSRARSIETLESIGGLPAHVAGGFTEISICARSSDGDYLIFDRRMHSVSSVHSPYDTARVLVQIGAEPGKLLHPSAFSLAADGRFVVADAPGKKGRIQVFLTSGASLGGFTLATREVPTLVFENYLQSGIGSLAFTGRSILINQPELGTLLSEYAMDGGVSRTFGTLRPTGQEHDREVNLALNTGLPIINPQGGFYFVFLGGVPMFRKYDAAGRLSFERHIEGPELDDYIRGLPNSWPKRRTEDGELPIVQPGRQGRRCRCGREPVGLAHDAGHVRLRQCRRQASDAPVSRSRRSWRHGRSSSRAEEPLSWRPGATSSIRGSEFLGRRRLVRKTFTGGGEEGRSEFLFFWVRRLPDSSDPQWPGTNETKQFLTDNVLFLPPPFLL